MAVPTRSASAIRSFSSALVVAWSLAACTQAAGPGLSNEIAGFEVEAECAAGDDVFAGDGEGRLVQFLRAGDRLIPVRILATNPDVETCVVGPASVYFLDPAGAIYAYDRDAETDEIMRPVYVGPPVGAAAFPPAAMRVVDAADGPVLRVLGASGEEATVAMDRPRARVEALGRPAAETEPVAHGGDAADDSVVVVRADSGGGWILGTDKEAGLHVYALDGQRAHFLGVGALNNVDALRTPEGTLVAAATNRTTLSIDLFHVDERTGTPSLAGRIALDYEEPYGLCMASGRDGVEVFAGDKLGNLGRWSIDPALNGTLVMRYRFDSLTEGCVFDGATGQLYVGEETGGIWRLDPVSGERVLFAPMGGVLVPDLEGLDIYRRDGERWLIASSQGDDTFVAFDLGRGGEPVKFRIAADPERGIDAVSETDGVAVTSEPLPGFPEGVLVVQDGRNVMPEAYQNFKLVDWRQVAALVRRGAAGEHPAQ